MVTSGSDKEASSSASSPAVVGSDSDMIFVSGSKGVATRGRESGEGGEGTIGAVCNAGVESASRSGTGVGTEIGTGVATGNGTSGGGDGSRSEPGLGDGIEGEAMLVLLVFLVL